MGFLYIMEGSMGNKLQITEEQRKEALEKAREARTQKKKDREANIHGLRDYYIDEGYWRGLASEYGVRMPNKYDKPSTTKFNNIRKKLGIEVKEWNDCYTSLSFFIKNNPTWGMFGVAGLLLEMKKGE